MTVDPTGIEIQAIARSAMRKAMWRCLPLILLAYVMAYMDRVNVSFAALRMNEDLGFSATIYGLGGGLFFLGYALFEVPSSLMLRRLSAPRWIARIMISWGLLSAGMMFVRTPLQFYAMRFLLGVAEAGFFPSMIFYFAGWFPMAWRGRAVSRIYIAGPLASVVMGGVSGSLLALDGTASLHGWQWLFLAQGLPSVLVGLVIGRFLPQRPESAAWLTGPERGWIRDELRRDAVLIGEPVTHSPWAAFRNPLVLLLGASGCLLNGAGNGLLLTAPAVLAAGAQLRTPQIGYLVSLGGVLAAIFVLVAGGSSDTRGDRLRDASVAALILVGALLLIGAGRSPRVVVAGYLLFVTAFAVTAALLVASWADVLPVRELAVGGAAINTFWQIGSFLSPYALGMTRDATGSYRPGLVGSAFIALALSALIFYLRARVHARKKGPRAAALPTPAG